jgi:CHAT domain
MTPDEERAADRAARTLACFEDYDRTGDPEHLSTAIAVLEEALRLAWHADKAPEWQYRLGLAYGLRADETGADSDHGAAIAWWTLVVGELAGRPEVDEVMPDLAELHFRHYLRCCAPADADADGLASEFLAVAAGLEELAFGAAARHTVGMLRGVVLLRRHDAGGREDDFRSGTELLEKVLPQLPPDTSWLAEAWRTLAWAYFGAHLRHGGAGWLRRAADAGRKGAAVAEETDPVWAECLLVEGYARETLSYEPDGEAERDAAIECLLKARAAGCDDTGLPFSCGTLLAERGGERNAPDDLAAAIPFLIEARTSPTDDDNRWLYMMYLADARRMLYELRGDTSARATICADYAAALATVVPDAEMEAKVHAHRVGVANEWLQDEPYGDAMAALRAAVTDADAAIDRLAAVEEHAAAELAGVLAFGYLTAAGNDLGEFNPGRVRHLVTLARGMPDPPAERDALLGTAVSLVDLYESAFQSRRRGATDYGVPSLVEAAEHPAMPADLQQNLARMLGVSTWIAGSQVGDIGRMRAARRLLEPGPGTPTLTPEDELIAFMMDTLRAIQLGATAPTAELTRRAEALAAYISPEQTKPSHLGLVHMLRALGFDLPAPPEQPSGDSPSGSLGRMFEGLSAWAASQDALMAALRADSEPRIRTELERLTGLAARLDRSDVGREAVVGTLGIGLLHLARTRGSFEAAANAVRWLEEATGTYGGEEHPLWATVILQLAEAYRLSGGTRARVRGREVGLAGLRGHVWKVLLQTGTDYAIDAARDASADALKVAGWCVEDGATEDLVRALDAGRGLVLNAATATRGTVERLRVLGQDGLAEEWSRASEGSVFALGGARLPTALRRRVVRALTDAGAARLLDPPSVGEIQAVLAGAGTDALVYLVPASEAYGGMAVIVPMTGAVVVLPLPGLVVGPGSMAVRYAEAYDAYQRAGEAGRWPAAERWRAALREVCDWAWRVAGRDLLGAVAGSCQGPQPRVVLVPMGVLALVPWHAASRETHAGPRYLAQDVVVSLAASARLLCQAAARPRCAPDGDVLILGNPTGDLAGAGDEADAIADFYPHATRLGRTREEDPIAQWAIAEDGRGTPDELIAWINRPERRRRVLHVAGHCIAEPADPGRSRLLLADGQLPVRDLLDDDPAALLAVEQVFLAACSSHGSGTDYDEAFSIASAFLAAGARTVFGSLWRVPDQGTSLLMYMLHHYLHTGADPAHALFLARRWMLDPHRQPPHDMPPTLSQHATNPTDLASWAGFIHLGG